MLFSFSTATLLASATTVVGVAIKRDICNANLDPIQIRLAYAGEGGMAISWNTLQQMNNPTVHYGLRGNLDHSASSTISTTYQTSSTWNNHVTISGLLPDTRYDYKIECDNRAYSFITPRTVGKGTSYKFAMVGDMGTFGPDGLSTTVGTGAANPLSPGEQTTINSLHSMKPDYDFIWHVGDIAYADAWLNEEKEGYVTPLNESDFGKEYDKILNDFFVEIEELSRDVPYMVAVGNHEANCDNGANFALCLPGQMNFTGYRHHWNMPSKQSGGLENFWYSWDHGMVHYITFNTETDFPNAPDLPGGSGVEDAGPFAPSGTQLAWLKADLAAVDRKKTPWIIAGGHRPWYVSTSECTDCQKAFEPLLIEYGVDLVLHGHKHFYERESAINNFTTQEIEDNPTAPWYIVNGAGGHYDGLDVPTYPLVSSSRKLISTEYGWSLFTVHNCTHLTTEFIATRNNSVLDTATLYKERTCDLD